MFDSIDQWAHVTEQGALAAVAWRKRNDPYAADLAATTAIRQALTDIGANVTVVTGEGAMDMAPGLAPGEFWRATQGDPLDLAIDPIDGTHALARDTGSSISVIALAPRFSLLPAPDIYMEKFACGPKLAGKLDMDDPLEDTIRSACKILGKAPSEFTVAILDRPRHRHLIATLRKLGVAIRLLTHGDVMAAVDTGLADGTTDLLVGSGGAPEGVLAAVALRALGGDFQARLLPQSTRDVESCFEQGLSNPHLTLRHKDIVGTGPTLFVATAITDCAHPKLPGIAQSVQSSVTTTLVLSSELAEPRRIRTAHEDATSHLFSVAAGGQW